jgi:hypothetical protein
MPDNFRRSDKSLECNFISSASMTKPARVSHGCSCRDSSDCLAKWSGSSIDRCVAFLPYLLTSLLSIFPYSLQRSYIGSEQGGMGRSPHAGVSPLYPVQKSRRIAVSSHLPIHRPTHLPLLPLLRQPLLQQLCTNQYHPPNRWRRSCST